MDSDDAFPFGPDDDARVPGQIVIKLAPDVETSVLSAESKAANSDEPRTRLFGIDELDNALAPLDVHSVTSILETGSDASFGLSGETQL